MLRIRTVPAVDEFVGAPNDPPDYRHTVASLWKEGDSRPEWCFVVDDGTTRVGRMGVRTSPTTSDPRWLGSLPPLEASVFGLVLPWETDPLGVGRLLLQTAGQQAGSDLPELLEMRINAAVHDAVDARVQFAEAVGIILFQEKEGWEWRDEGRPLKIPERLEWRSVDETGRERYAAVMARSGAGTLDRNDRYYWTGCGPDNWAAQMMEYLQPEDATIWLLGLDGNQAVGYVAVTRDPELVSTISHMGVVPERRGEGFVHDLLAAQAYLNIVQFVDRRLFRMGIVISALMVLLAIAFLVAARRYVAIKDYSSLAYSRVPRRRLGVGGQTAAIGFLSFVMLLSFIPYLGVALASVGVVTPP